MSDNAVVALLAAAITAALTFLLQRRKVNADAISILYASLASMGTRLETISGQLFGVQQENIKFAKTSAVQEERIGVLEKSLASSEKLSAERLELIDHLPAYVDQLKAFIVKSGGVVPTNPEYDAARAALGNAPAAELHSSHGDPIATKEPI